MDYLKYAKDTLDTLSEYDDDKHYEVVAQTSALIAIAEQLKRIADVLESQSGERGFHVSAETLPYQT